MYCNKCGAQLYEEDSFCRKCGRPVPAYEEDQQYVDESREEYWDESYDEQYEQEWCEDEQYDDYPAETQDAYTNRPDNRGGGAQNGCVRSVNSDARRSNVGNAGKANSYAGSHRSVRTGRRGRMSGRDLVDELYPNAQRARGKKDSTPNGCLTFICVALLVFIALFSLGSLMASTADADKAASAATSSAWTSKPLASPAQTAKATMTPSWTTVPRVSPANTVSPAPTVSPESEVDAAEREALLKYGDVDYNTSFSEIYKAYQKNEIVADELYQGNRYCVTGNIRDISNDGLLNLFGGATLTLRTTVGGTYVYFWAEFGDDELESLKSVSVGDTITIVGECLSWGNWTSCVLVE